MIKQTLKEIVKQYDTEKDIWLEIPDKGIKITTKLQFTNKNE